MAIRWSRRLIAALRAKRRLRDPLRTDTAATADDARAGVVPPVKQVRGDSTTGAFDPFVRRTIPDASPVRVHDERQVVAVRASASSDSTCCGGVQFTPTAVTRPVRVTARTASLIGVPSLR